MQLANEFVELSASIETELKRYQHLIEPLKRVAEVADRIGGSHSGSWMGYHSRVYYEDFIDPPAGADFSVEWGLTSPNYFSGTVGDWRAYAFDDVENFILQHVDGVKLDELDKQSRRLEGMSEDQKRNALSIFEVALRRGEDTYLTNLQAQEIQLELLSSVELVNAINPPRKIMSRDSEAIAAGQKFRLTQKSTPKRLPYFRVLKRLLISQSLRKVQRNIYNVGSLQL